MIRHQSPPTTYTLLPTICILVFIFGQLVTPMVPTIQAASLVIHSEKIFQEDRSQRSWQMQRSGRIKRQEEVQLYLETLNQGRFNDWRLPSKEELHDLFSFFDLKDNGKVKIKLEGKYWLAEEYGQPYVGSWEIGDQCGPSRSFSKAKAGYIRAVRP